MATFRTASGPLSEKQIDALLIGVRKVGDMQVAGQSTAPDSERRKSDGSQVSTVDLTSDKALRDLLGKLSTYPIISEEIQETHEGHNEKAIQNKGPVFIVDPLDGTREYLKGSPSYSIYIALLGPPGKDGNREPVFGLSYHPADHTVYYTGQFGTTLKGTLSKTGTHDALFAEPPQWVHASEIRAQGGKPTQLRVGTNGDRMPEFFHGIADKAEHVRIKHYSSAVGEGHIDAGLCPHRVSIWDAAALDALLRGSGASLLPIDDERRHIIAPRFYYGADPARYHGGKLFECPPYVSASNALLPYLPYAKGVEPPQRGWIKE